MFSPFALFQDLDNEAQVALLKIGSDCSFTFQQRKILVDWAADYFAWEGKSFAFLIDEVKKEQAENDKKQHRQPQNHSKELFKALEKKMSYLQEMPKNYSHFPEAKATSDKIVFCETPFQGKLLGRCPVSSEKTRCCRLMTLDAVMQCGFDCSYCSIQSFYHNNQVRFIKDLRSHLASIELDPNQRYHIGTGQSSDSLLWGNKNGMLDDLCFFAQKNPNLILEMKSKSDRIDYPLALAQEKKLPPNMIFTWSLNPPDVIRVEERKTASLQQRLKAARKLADEKVPVGFHLHPVILYDSWEKDYQQLVEDLISNFLPEEVITLSMGTLTFIKPVIKKVRSRMIPTKILQMPMEEIAGKWSYPYVKKVAFFSKLFSFFPKEWKESVFFYFCMEDPRLWNAVFGFEYPTNEDFEKAMIDHYFQFITKE